MDAAAAPEPPHEQGFADLLAGLDEGPVAMLNLLAFEPREGGSATSNTARR